jgi:hypothetical protein
MRGSAPLVVAASCLYGLILASNAWFARNGPTLAPNDARYAELLPLLRAGGLSGYVSDAAPNDRYRRYFRAQYNLAPRILLPGVDTLPVVVDGVNPRGAEELLARYGLRPIRDFGNGVVLAGKASH